MLTLFRFRTTMLLPHHECPRAIVHNNIFGGEGARRFQPQDSITLFSVSEFCSVIDNKCIRDNWTQERGQEGSSWCLTVTVVGQTAGIPSEKDDYTRNLTNSSRDCISLRKKSLGIIRSSGHFEGPDEVESRLVVEGYQRKKKKFEEKECKKRLRLCGCGPPNQSRLAYNITSTNPFWAQPLSGSG